jgi:hypothetical protein
LPQQNITAGLSPKPLNFFKNINNYLNMENWNTVFSWDFDFVWAIESEINYGLPHLVFNPDTIRPDSIMISPKPVMLNVGDIQQLSAAILPENALDKATIWSSSNTEVATVDANGLVTAAAAGSAQITAITYNGKADTCAVYISSSDLWTYVNPNGNLQRLVEADLRQLGQSGPNWDYTPVIYIKVSGIMAEGDFTFIKGGLATILKEVDAADVISGWPYRAFASCTKLQKIRLPLNTFLSQHMFYGCTSLTALKLGAAPFTAAEEGVIDFAGARGVGLNNTFNGCSAITTVRMPTNITMGQNMFDGCTRLSTLQTGTAPFEPNVIDLSGYVANLPEIAAAEWMVFSNCISITKVRISAYRKLQQNMFISCSNLTSLTVGNAVFEEGVIDLSGYSAASYENGVFYGCTAITKVRIPGYIDLPQQMFSNCRNLSELRFVGGTSAPAVNTSEDVGTFYNVKPTGTVYYPDGAWGYVKGVFGVADTTGGLYNWTFIAEAAFTHTGAILYQPSPLPAKIELYINGSGGPPIATATTGRDDGAYTLTIPTAPAGTRYTLVVTKPGYLSYTEKNLTLADLEEIKTIDIRQLAGDVNGDGIVNAVDLTLLLSEFNRKPVNFEKADIDGNGIVNAADLTYLLAGFNKRAVIFGD